VSISAKGIIFLVGIMSRQLFLVTVLECRFVVHIVLGAAKVRLLPINSKLSALQFVCNTFARLFAITTSIQKTLKIC
jgi:hypothetical protein